MTLPEFDAALRTAVPNVYELAAPKGLLRYVVWHRYGRQPTIGDDSNLVDLPKVQIDIVTNLHNDCLEDDVCEILWMHGIPYSVVSEGYDPEFNAYRTILQLVVI